MVNLCSPCLSSSGFILTRPRAMFHMKKSTAAANPQAAPIAKSYTTVITVTKTATIDYWNEIRWKAIIASMRQSAVLDETPNNTADKAAMGMMPITLYSAIGMMPIKRAQIKEDNRRVPALLSMFKIHGPNTTQPGIPWKKPLITWAAPSASASRSKLVFVYVSCWIL